MGSFRHKQPVWRKHRDRLLCALAFVVAALFSAASAAQAIRVETHPDHASVELGRDFLRAVFTLRQRDWPDGQPIRIFVMPDDSNTHDEFCREVLGIYPYVLRGTWDRLVYTGTGFAPTVVHSEEEMMRKVRSTPGAIGYVRIKATVSAARFEEISHGK